MGTKIMNKRIGVKTPGMSAKDQGHGETLRPTDLHYDF